MIFDLLLLLSARCDLPTRWTFYQKLVNKSVPMPELNYVPSSPSPPSCSPSSVLGSFCLDHLFFLVLSPVIHTENVGKLLRWFRLGLLSHPSRGLPRYPYSE